MRREAAHFPPSTSRQEGLRFRQEVAAEHYLVANTGKRIFTEGMQAPLSLEWEYLGGGLHMAFVGRVKLLSGVCWLPFHSMR